MRGSGNGEEENEEGREEEGQGRASAGGCWLVVRGLLCNLERVERCASEKFGIKEGKVKLERVLALPPHSIGRLKSETAREVLSSTLRPTSSKPQPPATSTRSSSNSHLSDFYLLPQPH